METINYPGITERHNAIIKENKQNMMLGGFMAVTIITCPMLFILFLKLFA
jgi:hypothetical protein